MSPLTPAHRVDGAGVGAGQEEGGDQGDVHPEVFQLVACVEGAVGEDLGINGAKGAGQGRVGKGGGAELQ